MANKRISQLPFIGNTGYTVNDIMPIVNYDVASGTTKHTPLSDLKSYIISGVTEDIITGGTYSGGTLVLNSQSNSVSVPGFTTGFNLPIQNGFDNNFSEPLLLNLRIHNLTTFSDSLIETIINGIIVQNTNTITDVDISNLKTVGDTLFVGANTSLNSVNLPNLISVGGNNTISGYYSLSNLNLSGLTSIGGSNQIDETLLTNLDLSNLTYVGTYNAIGNNGLLTTLNLDNLTFVGQSNSIYDNNSLVTVNLDNLTKVLFGSNSISNNPLLTSLDLSNLTYVGSDLDISQNNSLTTLDISNLTTVGNSSSIVNNSSLTTIQINPTGFTAPVYNFINNALSQTTVDNILVALSVSGVAPTTIDLTGGTNATPSATGLAAKAILVGLGWTVSNN